MAEINKRFSRKEIIEKIPELYEFYRGSERPGRPYGKGGGWEIYSITLQVHATEDEPDLLHRLILNPQDWEVWSMDVMGNMTLRAEGDRR